MWVLTVTGYQGSSPSSGGSGPVLGLFPGTLGNCIMVICSYLTVRVCACVYVYRCASRRRGRDGSFKCLGCVGGGSVVLFGTLVSTRGPRHPDGGGERSGTADRMKSRPSSISLSSMTEISNNRLQWPAEIRLHGFSILCFNKGIVCPTCVSIFFSLVRSSNPNALFTPSPPGPVLCLWSRDNRSLSPRDKGSSC